jgi:hypothetical protein
LEPENAAAVTNFARYAAGVEGVAPFLDEALAEAKEQNPPEGVEAVFVQACPEDVQVIYDQIWTRLKQ